LSERRSRLLSIRVQPSRVAAGDRLDSKGRALSRLGPRCLAVAAGLVLDRLLGEPPATVHPVAAFGRTMERIEQALWADR